MYYVYVIKSLAKPSFRYIGFSANLRQRLMQHNRGMCRSTKPYQPFKLVFYEAFTDKSKAQQRERYLKTTKGRRALKLMIGV